MTTGLGDQDMNYLYSKKVYKALIILSLFAIPLNGCSESSNTNESKSNSNSSSQKVTSEVSDSSKEKEVETDSPSSITNSSNKEKETDTSVSEKVDNSTENQFTGTFYFVAAKRNIINKSTFEFDCSLLESKLSNINVNDNFTIYEDGTISDGFPVHTNSDAKAKNYTILTDGTLQLNMEDGEIRNLEKCNSFSDFLDSGTDFYYIDDNIFAINYNIYSRSSNPSFSVTDLGVACNN